MKFALVENRRTKAVKGAEGRCPGCGAVVIARCGPIKVHHWAHQKATDCDRWWENETEWHRNWKDCYPDDWQEIPLKDKGTGERHIADVRTPHGLVLEFQHSKIAAEERTARENFYGHMVWVVDGSRLKWDYPRFQRGQKDWLTTDTKGHYFIDRPEDSLPLDWLHSSVTVVLDFQGVPSIENQSAMKECLYCLFPRQLKGYMLMAIVTRESFIRNTANGEWFKLQGQPKSERGKKPNRSTTVARRRQATHYFDPRKGRFVKKRRF